ncbi:MAG: gamma-glutamyltransferase family protein, partial [Bryobacterales bacterium]|nr:gamma-glutamyltransferase family protein [Bryobacterales bacterium]
ASGWSPRGLTIELVRSRGHETMPQSGVLSASVPGAVKGWEALHRRFGRLPWAELFAPAIYYARNGFPVTEIIAEHWREAEAKLLADGEAGRMFLPGGAPPRTGQVFRNPDLARAFELVAREGARAFYEGQIARALLRTSDRLGGVFAPEDLSQFEPEWVEPISTSYRGWTVYQIPPNTQGIAALQMLNIMERFPLPELPHASPQAWHYKIEAQKLAYEDLRRYVGDPRFARVPVAGLLSKDYAAERARLIRTDRAQCSPSAGSPPSGETVYLAVVDREGNIASLIQSIYLHFGSGVVVEGMGFHLHNRAALFVLDPGHPNALAPRKRPFTTIIPGYMERGELKVGFGIMGGYNQAQAHAQFVSNVVDHRMNIQAALEAPRFTKLNFGGCDLFMESRVEPGVRLELARLGHEIQWLGEYSGTVGGGQVVMHDAAARVNYGASSPRKDGAAIPEPEPYFERAKR